MKEIVEIKEAKGRRKDRLMMKIIGSVMVFAELIFVVALLMAVAVGSEVAFSIIISHDFMTDIVIIVSGLGIAACA